MSKKKQRNKMSKKRQRKVNVSGKPKHSFDVNRSNVATKNSRSAATVRRLKMYKNRPLRNCKGKLLSNEFQSKDLPNTRIQPDPRWFRNTRVVGQKELEFFREEMEMYKSSNYNVFLKGKNVLNSNMIFEGLP
jgi:nuclear GTP-binding protein